MSKNVIAIIPARGGSKRIPGKNIKEFLGKPIIAYSIEAALKSELFSDVMVSTDDKEIADVAVRYGADVPFLRSEINADDFATIPDVVNEVTGVYKTEFKRSFEYACCIFATAPLITVKRLKEGFELLKSGGFNSVLPVVPFEYPIWRSLEIVDGKTRMIWQEHLSTRSQDLKPAYHDAAQWFWYKPGKIEKTLFTDNSGSVILNELEVQDIDNMSDWKLAEIKYKLIKLNSNGQ